MWASEWNAWRQLRSQVGSGVNHRSYQPSRPLKARAMEVTLEGRSEAARSTTPHLPLPSVPLSVNCLPMGTKEKWGLLMYLQLIITRNSSHPAYLCFPCNRHAGTCTQNNTTSFWQFYARRHRPDRRKQARKRIAACPLCPSPRNRLFSIGRRRDAPALTRRIATPGRTLAFAIATGALCAVIIVQPVELDVSHDRLWHEVADRHVSAQEKTDLR